MLQRITLSEPRGYSKDFISNDQPSVLQDFSLTNFTRDVKDDEDVQALSEGEQLWAVILDPANHVVPTKVCMSHTLTWRARFPVHHCCMCVFIDDWAPLPQERVTFQPHPNTLTMAGELEYWAAQVCSRASGIN